MSEKMNVALTKCFYCGKDNDILLAIRYNRKGEPSTDMSKFHGKADPRRPCNECKEAMRKGVMLCEVRDGEKRDNPYRTGKLWVVSAEACKRIFKDIDFDGVRFIFIEERYAKRVGLHDPENNVSETGE